jgi:hypothetical protein
MFVADADMDKTCLRQGDILKNVLYPLVVADEVRFLGIANSSADPVALPWQAEQITLRNSPAWKCQMFARLGLAAVISQCCDIAPKNGRITRQPTIALARLVPVPSGPAKDPEKLASLQANKYPLNPEDPGYINYFYLPQDERLDGKDWVIDYGQVLSIPSAEFPGILDRKILQMTDDARIRFKIKLGASFGRSTQEEEQAGHPWLADQPPAE